MCKVTSQVRLVLSASLEGIRTKDVSPLILHLERLSEERMPLTKPLKTISTWMTDNLHKRKVRQREKFNTCEINCKYSTGRHAT